MQTVLALAALGSAAMVAAQSCTLNHPGVFSFQTTNVTAPKVKRDLSERQAVSCGSYVTIRLNDGVLSDGFNPPRVGNIVGNDQFQFDGPIQDLSQFTKGFQICDNKIAVGTDTTFYQCLSGDFYNIYYAYGFDQKQCNPVTLDVFECVPTKDVPLSATTSFPIKTGPISSGTGFVTPKVGAFTGSASVAASSSKASSSSSSTSAAAVTSAPSTSAAAVSSPKYPVAGGNATVPATGTGVVPVTSTTAAGKTTTAATSARASFTGAANMLFAGQKIVGAVAGAAALAMF